MLLILRLLLLLLSSYWLSACATASSYDDPEAGFVVGSIGFRAKDPQTLAQFRELYLHVRKEKNIFFDAYEAMLEKQGTELVQTRSFSYALDPGNYEVHKVRLLTSGFELVSDSRPLVKFTVEKGRISYIGLLELQMQSQDGLFTRVLDRQVLLANTLERQEEDMDYFRDAHSELGSLSVQLVKIPENLERIRLITIEESDSDYYHPGSRKP